MTDGQSTNPSSCQVPSGAQDHISVAGLLMWGALSDEGTSLSFAIAAGSRQSSHSRIRVPRDLRPYFTVSDSRLPYPGRPGPRIYILKKQGGPIQSQRLSTIGGLQPINLSWHLAS
jgi:hypothetical protein